MRRRRAGPPGCIMWPSGIRRGPRWPTRFVELIDAGMALDGAADHGVSEALYLHDPDQNGLELYWDRPRADWPKDADGRVVMGTKALDLHALLAEPHD